MSNEILQTSQVANWLYEEMFSFSCITTIILASQSLVPCPHFLMKTVQVATVMHTLEHLIYKFMDYIIYGFK